MPAPAYDSWKIVRFLEQYANWALRACGTGIWCPRAPCLGVARPSGRPHPDAFIPNPLTDRLIESLEDNGQLALTIEEFPTHETYQLKGRYLRHRPVEADDLAMVERFRVRFVRSVRW